MVTPPHDTSTYSLGSLENLRDLIQQCEEEMFSFMCKLSLIQSENIHTERYRDVYGRVENCAICLEPLKAPNTIQTPCNHRFHPHCILELLSHGPNPSFRASFPLCRRDLDENAIINIENGFLLSANFLRTIFNEEVNFSQAVWNAIICQGAQFYNLMLLKGLLMSLGTETLHPGLSELSLRLNELREIQMDMMIGITSYFERLFGLELSLETY